VKQKVSLQPSDRAGENLLNLRTQLFAERRVRDLE
jgi:hypothetical protein